jgi:hypothetical protein
MSGSQTYSEMINQPAASDAEVAAGTYPLLVPGAGSAPATTKLATAAQIAALFSKGLIYGVQTTQNAVPISIPDMPTLPMAGGVITMQGQLTAYDTVTGDTAVWNVAFVVSRVPNATLCQTQGDVTPGPFESTGTMATLASTSPPQLSANSAGSIILLTGIADNPVLFGYLLTYSETSIS